MAPSRVTLRDIRRYQEHLVERGISWSYFNQAVQAIRFFFRHTLRQYWKEWKKKPVTFLFPGRDGPDKPINPRTIQKIVTNAAAKAGLKKKVTTHTLRHSFGTHLLENGTNIRVIQQLLAHKNLNSTMLYTHVAKNGAVGTRSPLDDLKE